MAKEELKEPTEEELEPWDPKAEALEEDVHLERGDQFALMAAGCLTVGLPVTLLIIFICVVTYLLFT
ncbi:MAG: hypothetical protein IJR95_05755 [Lachnospiraceae bacterium]|nr:hypothetical protein [Lachnospiraceae bacterium]